MLKRGIKYPTLSCASALIYEVLRCVAVPIAVYGFQHYISMLGSIILIPLLMVPAMGGSPVSVASI